MGIELKDLGQTLAVGALAIYCLLILYRAGTQRDSSTIFSVKGSRDWQGGAVYLAAALAAGIILQDVSKRYVAGQAFFMHRPIGAALGDERELRAESLFEVKCWTPSHIRLIKSKPIYPTLVNSAPSQPAIQRLVSLTSIDGAVDIADDEADHPKVESFGNAVNSVYYAARNEVVRTETYFKELSEIGN